MAESSWRKSGEVLIHGNVVPVPQKLNLFWISKIIDEEFGLANACLVLKKNIARQYKNTFRKRLDTKGVELGDELGIGMNVVRNLIVECQGYLCLLLYYLNNKCENNFWQLYEVINMNIKYISPYFFPLRREKLVPKSSNSWQVVSTKEDVVDWLDSFMEDVGSIEDIKPLPMRETRDNLKLFGWADVVDSLIIKYNNEVESCTNLMEVENGRGAVV